MEFDKYNGAIIALWDDYDALPRYVGTIKKIKDDLYIFHWSFPYDAKSIESSKKEILQWLDGNASYRKLLYYGDEEKQILQFKLKHSEWFRG
jgi:hypothetical protein